MLVKVYLVMGKLLPDSCPDRQLGIGTKTNGNLEGHAQIIFCSNLEKKIACKRPFQWWKVVPGNCPDKQLGIGMKHFGNVEGSCPVHTLKRF